MAKSKKSDKIDCLLVHVPHLPMHDGPKSSFFANIIAVGVFSICNELKKAGFNPEIINMGVEKALDRFFDVAEYVKKNRIKIVGLSIHWHYQIYDSLMVAEHIKKVNPNTHVFLGGITASAFAEEILTKHPYIDTVIKGEGEKPDVELVSRIQKGNFDLSDIPNVYWKDDKGKIHKNKQVWFANEEELNSFSFDGLEFLKNSKTYLKFPIRYENDFFDYELKNLESLMCFVCCLGRGCPGNCTWCGGGFNAIKCITGRDRITIRDPKIVAKELINLKTKYDNIMFYFCYDPTPTKQDYLVELFNLLGKAFPKKIRIDFECFGLPTKEFVDAFGENLAPSSTIILSPEFGAEYMRKEHRAFYFSNAEFIGCVDYIGRKGIPMQLYFTEIPYEPAESKAATLELMKIIRHITRNSNAVKFSHQPIADIEPFSPWAVNHEKYGMPKPPDLQYYISNSKALRDFI